MTKQPTPGEIAVCEVFGWDIDTLRDVEGYDHARNAAATLDEHIAKLEKDLRQAGDRQRNSVTTLSTGLSASGTTGLTFPQDVRPIGAVSAPTALTPVAPIQRVVQHGDVEVVVVLGPDGRFLGIAEVRVRRDFLSTQQRIAASGFHDVDHIYKE
jgi:hypothetical protein